MGPFEIFIIIQFLCVFIIDYSGAVEDLLTPIVKRLTGARIGRIGKPFNCSLCSTLWTSLLYLIIAGLPFFEWIWVIALLCIMTPVTYAAINFVKDFCFKVFEWLYAVLGI